MRQYHELLELILAQGAARDDRTGTGTLGIFGHQMRFNLQEGFPLLTTKKLHWKSIAVELLWFLRGDTNLAYLKEHGVRIWDEWATPEGELGPLYGKQWTRWATPDGREINQMAQVVEQIRARPNSRRLIVSAWNPADLPDESVSPQDNVLAGRMALAACHALFQFQVSDGRLNCQLYQRSADVFLGVPFNIASYALLTHMVAQQCDLQVGDFVWTGGDVHLYRNTLDQAREQLTREPYPLPSLKILRRPPTLFEYELEDFVIENYQAHPHISAKVAV